MCVCHSIITPLAAHSRLGVNGCYLSLSSLLLSRTSSFQAEENTGPAFSFLVVTSFGILAPLSFHISSNHFRFWKYIVFIFVFWSLPRVCRIRWKVYVVARANFLITCPRQDKDFDPALLILILPIFLFELFWIKNKNGEILKNKISLNKPPCPLSWRRGKIKKIDRGELVNACPLPNGFSRGGEIHHKMMLFSFLLNKVKKTKYYIS